MKLYANSKPFSQVINPFQFDQAFSVHGDNWNLGCVWLHGKSGFEFKVRVLDLAIERDMQNGLHPHPWEILPQIMTLWIPLYRSSWKNCSREQCFFLCLLCVRMRDNRSLKNSSNFFLLYPRNTDYQRSNLTCIATT